MNEIFVLVNVALALVVYKYMGLGSAIASLAGAIVYQVFLK